MLPFYEIFIGGEQMSRAKRVIEKGVCRSYEGTAIVCFLDILGFSKYIENTWKVEGNHPLQTILNLKNIVKSKAFSNGFIYEVHNGEETKVTKFLSNVKTISDSVIILVPINTEDEPEEIFNTLMGMSHIIIDFWSEVIKIGFSIRGGIEYGDVYWNEDEIIGPAFIKAYNLESKYASTSRVICGDQYTDFLFKLLSKTDLGISCLKYCDSLLSYYMKDIVKDKKDTHVREYTHRNKEDTAVRENVWHNKKDRLSLSINPAQMYMSFSKENSHNKLLALEDVQKKVSNIRKNAGCSYFQRKYDGLLEALDKPETLNREKCIEYLCTKI